MKPYAVTTLENEALRLDLAPALSGRVIRMIDKRTGADILRRPDPGERQYPDVAGLALLAHPDYQARAWELSWELARPAERETAELVASYSNGLKLRRTIRLDGRGLRTETAIENTGPAAVQFALQARAEVNPGRAEDPNIALGFRSVGGGQVDKTLFCPGTETEESETYAGPDRPDGEWRAFHRAGGLRFINRFPTGEAGRAVASWSVRDENRIVLSVWTEERVLSPGQTLRFTAGYAVE
jgi:hypothetical protein